MQRQVVLRGITRLRAPIQQRRFAHHEPQDDHPPHNSEPIQSESLGTGFYVLLGVPIFAVLLYQASHYQQSPTADGAALTKPWLTRMLAKWDETRAENANRQVLHAHMVEKAAQDRLLFMHAGDDPVPYRKVHVRNLEMINARDSFNRQAGWGSINLAKLQAHIDDENAEEDRKTLEKYQAYLDEQDAKEKIKEVTRSGEKS